MALITSANAAQLQANSRRVIAEKKAEAEAELQRLRLEAAKSALAPLVVSAPAEVLTEYAGTVLVRVRLQLDLINKRLTQALEAAELDPQAIDRLSNSQMRLAEQERILAGRPLPGSHRPSSKPARQVRQADLGATEVAPQPQPVVPRVNDPNEPNG